MSTTEDGGRIAGGLAALTLLLTKDSGMEVGDFYHSIIFRLFLFVLLVLYYFVWYRTFAKRKCRLQEKLCKRIGC